MREIKFRAWNGHTKDMVYLEGIKFSHRTISNIESILLNDNKWHAIGSSLIVMQFTGLQDSDGKDIYEGDEVHILDKLGRSSTCVVEFIDGGFVVTQDGSAYCEHLKWFLNLGKSKVVGNIH